MSSIFQYTEWSTLFRSRQRELCHGRLVIRPTLYWIFDQQYVGSSHAAGAIYQSVWYVERVSYPFLQAERVRARKQRPYTHATVSWSQPCVSKESVMGVLVDARAPQTSRAILTGRVIMRSIVRLQDGSNSWSWSSLSFWNAGTKPSTLLLNCAAACEQDDGIARARSLTCGGRVVGERCGPNCMC